MIIKKAEIIAVAVKKEQYPPNDRKEVAFVGRSNVGKSSLINLLLNRRNIARVSGNPGKTRTINFYEINDTYRIVDLPGYGYAKVSRSLSKDWGPMIESYLSTRPNLVKVIQLVDVRHPPSELDVQMYEWLRRYKLDGTIVATKADKVSRNELAKCLAQIRKTLSLNETDIVIPVSTLKRTGVSELMQRLEELLEG